MRLRIITFLIRWVILQIVIFYVLQVAIDSATPVDDAGTSGNFAVNNPEPFGHGAPAPLPMRAYGRMYWSLDFDDVSTDIISCLVHRQCENQFSSALYILPPFCNKCLFSHLIKH